MNEAFVRSERVRLREEALHTYIDVWTRIQAGESIHVDSIRDTLVGEWTLYLGQVTFSTNNSETKIASCSDCTRVPLLR